MSDGPTSQYRNRKMFYIITQYFPLCYPQIEFISYNFSEAGHGKSAADGIGSTLIRLADDRVKFGHDISTFDMLVSTLSCSVRKIHIRRHNYVTNRIYRYLVTEKISSFYWYNENAPIHLE